MKNKIIIVFHFLLVIISWTSWIWLSWDIIAVLSLAHIVMLESFDGCFLSHAQFKDKDNTNTAFYEWWLKKIGIKNYNRNRLKIFMRYWVPLILVLLGILMQEVFHFIVLF